MWNRNSFEGTIPSVCLGRVCPALYSWTWVYELIRANECVLKLMQLKAGCKVHAVTVSQPTCTTDSLITRWPVRLITKRTVARWLHLGWVLAVFTYLPCSHSSTPLFHGHSTMTSDPLLQLRQHAHEIPIIERKPGIKLIISHSPKAKGQKKLRGLRGALGFETPKKFSSLVAVSIDSVIFKHTVNEVVNL